MPREIWLGPILNRNRERLVARCRDMLRDGRGRDFVYLAATKPLMESVSASLLEGEVAGTVDQLNVFLLSGFSRRVFARARYSDTNEPIPYFAAIDSDLRPVQKPLFSRLLARLAEANRVESFGQLARSDGVVSSMAGLVAEIQRAGKTADEFELVVKRREALEAESKPAPEAPELPAEDAPESERREAERIAAIDYDRDTATLYKSYESILDERLLTDASRDYLRALMVLRGEFENRPVRVPFVDEARLLIVDGFFDILPVHAEILSLLIRRFPESVVNLNFDERNPAAYRAFRDVVERFGDRAGFDEVYVSDCRPVAEHLHALRTDLFNPAVEPAEPDPEAEPVEDTADHVRLVHAPDRPREVRAVAKEIKRLVFDEGYAPHEIAVVYRDRGRYEGLVRDVFREEGVAASLGERRALTDLASARAAMKVLDAALSNRTREGRQIRVARVVAVLKSDYFALAAPAHDVDDQGMLPFDDAPPAVDLALSPDDVENAVAFVGAELNLDDWLRRAHRLISRLAGEEHARRLVTLDETSEHEDDDEESRAKSAHVRLDFPVETLRKAAGIVEAVGRVILSIPYEAPAREMADAFRGALADLDFEPRLYAAAREASFDEADLRRAALDLRGLEGLRRAVDAVVEAVDLTKEIATPRRDAGDTRITRAEFRAELQRAMESHEMLVAPESEGAVKVLVATDLRGMAFPVVFVLGLVEGEFPARTRGDWIYPQHERQNFRDVGLPLEDLSPEDALRNEEHYFYQVVCRATDRLVLCRPLAADDDSDTIPSYFLAEIEKATGRALEPDVTSAGFDGETLLEATTPAELARAVVRTRASAEGEDRAGAVLDELERFATTERPGRPPILSASALRRIEVERGRDTGGYDEYDGLVRNDFVRHLLSTSYGAHAFSASELNEFGHCAFRFFLKRVLALTPRVEAALDLQALETGVLLHDSLRRFFERYRGRSIANEPIAELREALAAASDAVFDAFERGMPPLNPKLWLIERRVLGILLERVLDDEVELQRRLAPVGVAPRYLELAFGLPHADADPHSSPDPLVLRRDDEPEADVILLRGQIDRVDASEDGTLVAYDYKTSTGPRLTDMEEGRDLQLGIYLTAVERLFAAPDEEIAGGGYYALKPVAARRNNGLYRGDLSRYTDVKPSARSSVSPDEFVRYRAVILANLWDAYDKIRAGDFRLAPSLDEKTCEHCDYPRVCRFERHRIHAKRVKAGGARSRRLRMLDELDHASRPTSTDSDI